MSLWNISYYYVELVKFLFDSNLPMKEKKILALFYFHFLTYTIFVALFISNLISETFFLTQKQNLKKCSTWIWPWPVLFSFVDGTSWTDSHLLASSWQYHATKWHWNFSHHSQLVPHPLFQCSSHQITTQVSFFK